MTHLDRLHQVGARVEDFAATRAFWSDTLGARCLAEFDPPGLLFFDFNGTRLLFEQGNNPATLYLWVDDIDAVHADLVAAGVVFEGPPHLIHTDREGTFGPPGNEEWMAFFRDPGGNTIALASQRPSAPR